MFFKTQGGRGLVLSSHQLLDSSTSRSVPSLGPLAPPCCLWCTEKLVSPWHEIPLWADDGNLYYVNEIPKNTSAKMEVAIVSVNAMVYCMSQPAGSPSCRAPSPDRAVFLPSSCCAPPSNLSADYSTCSAFCLVLAPLTRPHIFEPPCSL